jgi:hypothetical protein
MPYEFYKFLHFFGLFLLISGLMGVFVTTWNGQQLVGRIKVFSFSLHGLGLFLILLSGFGLLARLGLAREMPTWAYVKLAIWGTLALFVSLLKRKGHLGWPIYLTLLTVLLFAAYTATYKPF